MLLRLFLLAFTVLPSCKSLFMGHQNPDFWHFVYNTYNLGNPYYAVAYTIFALWLVYPFFNYMYKSIKYPL